MRYYCGWMWLMHFSMNERSGQLLWSKQFVAKNRATKAHSANELTRRIMTIITPQQRHTDKPPSPFLYVPESRFIRCAWYDTTMNEEWKGAISQPLKASFARNFDCVRIDALLYLRWILDTLSWKNGFVRVPFIILPKGEGKEWDIRNGL